MPVIKSTTKQVPKTGIEYTRFSLPISISNNYFNIESIEDTLERHPEAKFGCHCQAFYSIILFFNGGGIHSIGGYKSNIKDFSVYFVSPDQMHHVENKDNHKGYIITFTEEFFFQGKDDSADKMFKNEMFNLYGPPNVCTIGEADRKLFLSLIANIQEENGFNEEKIAHKEYLAHLLSLFCIELKRKGKWNQIPHHDYNNVEYDYFVKFLTCVNKNFRTMHSVQEYSLETKIPIHILMKCVKQFADKSPLTFINDRIVTEAKVLLIRTNMKIQEIAMILGYENPSYFIKVFRKLTGVSPVQFRNSFFKL